MPEQHKIVTASAEEQEHPIENVAQSRSPRFARYYVNTMQVLTTNFDIQLLFSDLTVGGDKGEPTVEHQCVLAMSFEHAKAVTGTLLQQIRQREQRFGELHLVAKPTPEAAKTPPPKPPEPPSSIGGGSA